MEKKKRVIIVVVVLVVLVGIVSFVCYGKRETVQTPLDRYADVFNHRNMNELPKIFHEYCSTHMEQELSNQSFKERFENNINNVIDEYGENFKVSYEITDIVECSEDDVKEYESHAKSIYANAPYLSSGKDLKFEAVYEVEAKPIVNDSVEDGALDFKIVKIRGKYYFLDTEIEWISW